MWELLQASGGNSCQNKRSGWERARGRQGGERRGKGWDGRSAGTGEGTQRNAAELFHSQVERKVKL